MSRYDGLIIPRSYSEYINKTDAATLLQALQLSGVMDNAPTANSNHPIKSSGVDAALKNNGTLNQLINLLPEGTSGANKNDYIIAQHAGGSTNAYYRRTINNALKATNEQYGISLGAVFIEYIDTELNNINITSDGSIYSISGVGIYQFKYSFSNPPIVLLTTQSTEDYVYSAPIGLIVNKTQINSIKLIRPTNATGTTIKIRGIAIGM